VAIWHPEWTFVDTLGAVLVSAFILHAAVKIIWPCILEISDAAAPQSINSQIEQIAEGVAGVHELHELRTRRVGSSIHADIHIVVDGHLSVLEGHRIADRVRDQVRSQVADVVDVLVHVDPYDDRSEYLLGIK